MAGAGGSAGSWIPAFAGMTREGRNDGLGFWRVTSGVRLNEAVMY